MADTWVTDMNHFLDDDGLIAASSEPARRLAEHLARIIVDATTLDFSRERRTAPKCRRRPKRKPCQGIIETDVENVKMTRKISEVYVSTDVETDGPIPGPHSMLGFASAAYLLDKTLLGTYSANLTLLPEATGHPETMKWWQRRPEAWAATRKDARDPAVVMPEYLVWVKSLPGKPVFVAYPAGFDFMFVYWYLIRFAGRSPFSHSALDIKTLAMVLLNRGYRDSTKKNMPRHWFDKLPHTHVALDDAIEQGALFCNMMKELMDTVRMRWLP